MEVAYRPGDGYKFLVMMEVICEIPGGCPPRKRGEKSFSENMLKFRDLLIFPK